MKNSNSIIVLLGLIMLLLLSSCDKNNTHKNKNDLEKIELNHIAVNAADNNIEDVDISKKVENEISKNKQIELYEVKQKKYNQKELNIILKKCFDDKIIKAELDNDMDIYLLEKGGSLTYYKNSGGISYSKTLDGDYDSSSEIIDDNKLIGISKAFIEKSDLFELNDLLLDYVRPSMYVEDDKAKKIERYEVNYQKKPPKGIDGYVGNQPGISVEIDCYGEVIGFMAFDRTVKKTSVSYPYKRVKDIEKDIVEDRNVMLDFEGNPNNATFSQLKYVLYCDSVLENQKYIVPHYEMIDVKNNIIAVLPAIDNDYIKIK